MRSELAALLARLDAALLRRGGPEALPVAAAAIEILRREHDPVPGAGSGVDELAADGAIAGIGAVFGLDETDRTMLLAAAAPDLDANVGLVYASLCGAEGTSSCTTTLALELAGVPPGSADAFARLGPVGPLTRAGLVVAVTAQPWARRCLQVPDPVLAAVAGAPPEDPLVAPLRTTSIPLELPGGTQVAAAIEAGARLVWIHSVRGAAGSSLAAGALESMGVTSSTLDLARVASTDRLPDVLRAGIRDAGLRRCALILLHAEVLAERGGAELFAALAGAPVPVLCVGARVWNPGWLPELPLLVTADRLDIDQRDRLWRANLGDIAQTDGDLRQTLLALRMDPETIAKATRYARTLAAGRGQPLSAGLVREAARRASGAGELSSSVGDGDSAPTFDDLMLPSGVAASLQQLVSWARHRDEVGAQGLVRNSGHGIAALFAGNPGTGKTLAAHVIAHELSMDLYQVELSSVVDKYIGETEKNLEQVFQAAEALDVVLFFDEADALFGSRSEVRDARDRYANQEIAYLLQRMEQFDGITILATNLRGNLDRAFSRRMSFIISFPDPDQTIRGTLWRHHLDQLDALDQHDPVRFEFLAATAEITGGDIRNIVRAAAFDARAGNEPVGMRHVVAATVREYRKLGRVLPEHGFIAASVDRARGHC